MPVALLTLSVFLESFSTFPFVLVLLTFLSIFEGKKELLVLAFASGLLLDIFLFRPIGGTSGFLVIFAFLIVSYQSKFEADTLAFISIFTFLGSFLYLLFTSQVHALLISIFASLIASLVYKIYKAKSFRRQKKW